MSYDVYMVIDAGGDELATVCDVGIYTWNVSEMYYACLGDGGINSLKGKKGKTVIGKLRRAIRKMQDNPVVYKKLNPVNGWGDYPGAMKYLREILDACIKYPKATVRVA